MDPPQPPPPKPPSDSRIRKPLRKRQKNTIKPTIFDVPRARNCGADNSFLSTETTGMMDYTCGGSSTEEEDMTEIENEYRNRMTTDNTDRPAETIFGKGVKVWKSFSGSGRIYADLEDHIKKQQREKLLWKDEKQKLGMGAGGKRKRGEKMTNEGVSGLPVKYAREMDYSMQVKTETSDEDQMLTDQMSDKKQSSNHNEPGTYTDGNITYPDLPVLINTFVANTGIDLPPSPTESEWNRTFQLSMSQVEDVREPIPAPDTLPPELLRQALNENMFHHGSAGVHRIGNLNQAVQSADEYARDLHMADSDLYGSSSMGDTGAGVSSSSGLETLSPATGVTTPSSLDKDPITGDDFMAFCHRDTPSSAGGRLGFVSSLAGGARRMISDSFGGPEDGPVDWFDDRGYRFGQKGDGEQNDYKGKGKAEESDEGGKPNPFKGRPWLRKL
ncbi:hypothetical protein PtrSN002B_010881 [Pyrenophora tritici-repentis]|uniref:Uncharacterized protein n=3 Tax=Pyrenophora tritici-repentis TaxID=45151 RepID=A0A2W1GBG3_9PLEO|nr:uncharacterized protein PTRG_05898 [Pyrenophora tritici-repentis Pt-1C-BFP]KAA8619013.1 hypothetical protein PtrV1_08442 [Pyrenophora tritici-repentis]EDU48818.1 predicted protein [Pyrenophora tritici-repentis Pt-1C-BFP]KAF7449476.1 hypothetical protein A1F99_065250 [Pyrenophora tritici-repentis]KAG9383582.1 hypothetical protein A1F94_005493 [Pyrenophora tritici-repentis]KAI0571294.1 hypothetical protein Alg215_10489 [Pyrenophora tritici-repentis]